MEGYIYEELLREAARRGVTIEAVVTEIVDIFGVVRTEPKSRLSPHAHYTELDVRDGVSDAVNLQKMLRGFSGRKVGITIEPLDER